MARGQSETHPNRLLRGEILRRWEQLTTADIEECGTCLLYTSPSPRDRQKSRMPSSA